MTGKQSIVLVLATLLGIAHMIQFHVFESWRNLFSLSSSDVTQTQKNLGPLQFGLTGSSKSTLYSLGLVLATTWIAGLGDVEADAMIWLLLILWLLNYFNTNAHPFTPK